MARGPRSQSIKALANQRAEDAIWGIPESPEFSVVQQLMNEFRAHENDEAQWLSNYRKIAEEAEDSLVQFLLNLIIADEEQHHQIIDHMIARLKNDLAWTKPERISQRKKITASQKPGLRETLDRFVEVERRGIKEYERLSKVSGGVGHSLFGLLCRTMIHDSEKHIGILEFLRVRTGTPKASKKNRLPKGIARPA